MDFDVPVDLVVKLKEREKMISTKTLQESSKTMKVTVILNIVGAFGTITYGLVQVLGD